MGSSVRFVIFKFSDRSTAATPSVRLTRAPFDDPDWVFEDKFFRMVAQIRRGRVALYSRNGKIISRCYVEVAKALEGVKMDAVIDGARRDRQGRRIPFPVASERPAP